MLKTHGHVFFQVILKSKDDQVTVIGAGVTLHEALAAAEQLRKGGAFFPFSHVTQKKKINTSQHNCSPFVLVSINYTAQT